MRCKLLEKRSTGKTTTTECSKHLRHIAIEIYIFNLTDAFFKYLYYIKLKLVIPKILFILVLSNFNFYFKIMQPPSHMPTKLPPLPILPLLTKKTISEPQAKTFLKFLLPPPSPPPPFEFGGIVQ